MLAFLVACSALMVFFTARSVIQIQFFRQEPFYIALGAILFWLGINYYFFLLLTRKFNLRVARTAYLVNIAIGLLASEVFGYNYGYNLLITLMYFTIVLLLTLIFSIQEMFKSGRGHGRL